LCWLKWQKSIFIIYPYFFNKKTFTPSKNEIDPCDNSWLGNFFSDHPNDQEQNEHNDDFIKSGWINRLR